MKGVSGVVAKVMDLRLSTTPAWVLLIQLFIGLGWLRAAVAKLVDPTWWSGTVILDFAAANSERTLGWYQPLLDHALLPASSVVAVVVVAGQIVAGVLLVTGQRLHEGIFIGMTMNLNFVIIGAVDPSIFYLILQAALALWLFENHAPTGLTRSYLRWIIRLAVLLAAASLPYIRTLDPSDVVDDPAIVLVTYSMSIGTSSWLALRRLAPASE